MRGKGVRISRRNVLTAAIATAPALLMPGGVMAARSAVATVERALAALERRQGGKLGVAILDAGSGRLFSHRGGEYFPLCSTHKFITVAHVLARVDRGEESLSRRVPIRREDLVPYAPATEPQIGKPEGMTIADLCAASITLSDNVAANLLYESVGGPAQVTAYVRTLGDGATSLDRLEPQLNDVAPDDRRDSSTPIAIARLLRQLSTGGALSPASRDRFNRWMVANTTGDKRLRAGVPAGWTVGDKTGTGPRNATNDVAIIWPAGDRAPIFVSALYVDAPEGAMADREKVLAEVGRIAAGTVAAG
jgi:beta-lactamase class A